MATRYTRSGRSRFAQPPLPTGYDTGLTSNLTIPAVGIEDVDRALFELFDKEIRPQVATGNGITAEIRYVPIIFAASEKWALAKRQTGIKDRNGSLILPLITVVRTSIQQSTTEDIAGRGINQQVGELTVKRRLENSDRTYQGLINRLLVNHQANLAVSPAAADDGQASTLRAVGDMSDDPIVASGGLLRPNLMNNVWEFLTIPTPQFFTAMYEVTLWTQYTTQMNQLLESLYASFLPQGNAWRLETEKGYWFIATVDDNVYNSETNIDDMSTEERVLKYKFTIKVPAYVLATNVPGAPVPVKRYVSAPEVRFDVGVDVSEIGDVGTVDDPFLGADDPTLTLADGRVRRRDQRDTNETRLYPGNRTNVDDPALRSIPRGRPVPQYRKIVSRDRSGREVVDYVRVSSSNPATGESTYSSDIDLGGISIVVVDKLP